MNESNNPATVIVNALSAEIMLAATALDAESTHPTTTDPDRMDDRIKFYRERVTTLRTLRDQFETEMAKSTP